MKHTKMLGSAVAAAALLAACIGAGAATATQLTEGKTVLGVGTHIEAEAEKSVTLHPAIGEITCNHSKVTGQVAHAGSATTTVSGGLENLTFENCNTEEIKVLKKGSLEIHTQGASNNNNGTLTSTGAEVTVKFAGFHCIFTTNKTDLGVVTGSNTVIGTATLDIDAEIPRTGGSSGIFCGGDAEWTGFYRITSPELLDVH